MNRSIHLPTRPRVGAALIRWRERLALAEPVIAFGRWLSAAAYAIDTRRARPWLAMVAVPLAMNASLVQSLWWTWPPLAVCMWWWADRSWSRTWLVGIESAALGTAWMMAGSSALAEFTDATWNVGALWILGALALALTSFVNRRSDQSVGGNGSGY